MKTKTLWLLVPLAFVAIWVFAQPQHGPYPGVGGGGIAGVWTTGTGLNTTTNGSTLTINGTLGSSGAFTNSIVAYGGDPATAAQTNWFAEANGGAYETNKAGGLVTISNGVVTASGGFVATGGPPGIAVTNTMGANGDHVNIGTNGSITATGTNDVTTGTRTFHHDSSHTVITNTTTLTSTEFTAGSQFEWYNGAKTITVDKTNGLISVRGLDYTTNAAPIWTPVIDGNQGSLHIISATNITLNVTNFPTTTARYPSATITNSGANASTILVTCNGFCVLTNGYPTSTFYVTNLTAKRQQTRVDVCLDPVGNMTNGIVTHLFDK